jgi:lipid-A-disaccharide synthase-like uncharacterized protein
MPTPTEELVKLAGWLGQGLFFSRGLVQWLQSERAKKSVSTPIYWWFSLLGTLLVTLYSAYKQEPILLLSFAVNLGIYARNLLFCSRRFGHIRVNPLVSSGLTVAMALGIWLLGDMTPKDAEQSSPLWVAIGSFGLLLWSSRFLYQWWASERLGHSHFPAPFWYLSLAGNLPMLAYALHLGDPLFIASFALGPLTQIRNLILLHRAQRESKSQSPAEPPPYELTPQPTPQLALDLTPARQPSTPLSTPANHR